MVKGTQEEMRAEMLEQGLSSEDIDIVIDFFKRAEERDRQAEKVKKTDLLSKTEV